MSRRPRNGVAAIRLTAYVSQETFNQIHRTAELDNISVGQVIDGFFTVAQLDPIAPVIDLPRGPLSPPVDMPRFGTGLVWFDHPGWRLNGIGQNVCTRCGKQKSRARNQSCTAP